MGRMFRIISEGGPERPAIERIAPVADEVPFVEVGGPNGVVMSHAAPPRVVLPRPELVPTVAIPDAADDMDDIDESYDSTVETSEPEAEPRVLSVAFHRFPKSGLRLVPTGVATDLVVYHFPDHPVSREYQEVREEIRGQFDAGPRVVVFTAAAVAAGTTTVLLNCAASLTRDGAGKVLVVDANFARPAVARRLGVSETPGLAEVLRQTTPLAWAVQPTAVENLHVLAAGDDAETFEGASLTRLVGQLRQWFDWVLVDAGVWADADARESLAPTTDGVYLVSRQPDIHRPEFTGLRNAVCTAGGVPKGYITTRY
ncbi:MAG: tyrosine-protein kinase family protein [Fimbriiglobus sp.]